jgi:uncharacterized protein YdeI (YjbR/CyaY-like superfamily)
MSPTPTPRDVVYFASPEELRAWFERHHESATELWVGYWKKATGRPTLSWPDAVDEALCVGWIDGVRYSIDAERHAQRFTPRRRGSIWSAINVAKVEKLTVEGRMRPAGLAAYADRTPERTGVYSYERTIGAFTDDELARFQANDAGWAEWQRRPPSYQRQVFTWLADAKRSETRERRFVQVVAECERGTRRPR